MSIDYYQPASLLTFRLSDGSSTASVEVVSAFTPFTMAQVLLVKTQSLNRNISLLPSEPFILKIYDPRFYSHRQKFPRHQVPWTSTAEAAAAAKRSIKGRNPEFEQHVLPEENDKAGWEEWYYQNAELQYYSEVSAYAALTSLQGKGIPKCYGSGTLEGLSDRAISPRLLLLEYVPDPVRLDAIRPKDNRVDFQVLLSLVETVRQFGSLGVVHTDLNPKNILFSPAQLPSRAVVIDFGEAGVRLEEDKEGIQWAETVRQNADVRWLIVRLEDQLGVPRFDLGEASDFEV